ncbi:hypothetical protein ACK56M_10015 [Pseudomonas sp. s4]|uniref:hypothetical protein n=1 Tax=Pseudomonas sp. s4 TaxID=353218 RepID=UPI00398D26C8
MDTNKMREEFETSPKFRGMDFTRSSTHPDYYQSAYANGAWDGWKASREAVVVELPSEDTCRTSTSKEEAVQEAYNHALGECRTAIEAQGLKVAP